MTDESATLLHPYLTVALAVVCVVVPLILSDRVEDRLHDGLVRRSRGSAWRAVGLVALVNSVLVVCWLVVAVVAQVLADAGGTRAAAGWVTVPAILALAPCALAMVPWQFSQWTTVELRHRGASPWVSRALALTMAPFGIFHLACASAAWLGTFMR